MSGRRANNEGTIYWDQKLKRFIGQFSYTDAAGKVKRKKITGKKKSEVLTAGQRFLRELEELLEQQGVERHLGLRAVVVPRFGRGIVERVEIQIRAGRAEQCGGRTERDVFR